MIMSISDNFHFRNIATRGMIAFQRLQDTFLKEAIVPLSISMALLTADSDVEGFACLRIQIGLRECLRSTCLYFQCLEEETESGTERTEEYGRTSMHSALQAYEWQGEFDHLPDSISHRSLFLYQA